MIKPSVLFLTLFPKSPELNKCVEAYLGNGYETDVAPFYHVFNTEQVRNQIIVDLDSYDGKDNEMFKERLAEMATRILLVCTTSFQRLKYYEDFEVYTSYTNLLEREFFGYYTKI
jgi:hypothetical protein